MEKGSDRKINKIIEQLGDLKKPTLEVEFSTHARKIGNSLFIPVLKPYQEQINLEDGDNIDVWIIKKDKIIQSYVCKLCSHRFDTDDDVIFCPACDAEGEDIKLLILKEKEDLKGDEK